MAGSRGTAVMLQEHKSFKHDGREAGRGRTCRARKGKQGTVQFDLQCWPYLTRPLSVCGIQEALTLEASVATDLAPACVRQVLQSVLPAASASRPESSSPLFLPSST